MRPAADPSADRADAAREVRVRAAARLHLGFIDPAATLGRRYGSIGLAVDAPATELSLSAAAADSIVAPSGRDVAERVARHVDTLRRATGRRAPLRVELHSVLPSHAGLGSGTQLALAIGRAFSEWFGLALGTAELARLLGRGQRSGIGIACFDAGGFVVDGGLAGPDGQAPLLFRAALPDTWRVVLVRDRAASGLHGADEARAIDGLPPFPREHAARISHELVMRVMPALVEARFEPFARGIGAIQRLVGEHFAPAQGGDMYTSAAVGRLLRWIADAQTAGVGQSSWGPTGFALMPSAEAAEAVLDAARAAGAVDARLDVSVVRALDRGADVSSGPARR